MKSSHQIYGLVKFSLYCIQRLPYNPDDSNTKKLLSFSNLQPQLVSLGIESDLKAETKFRFWWHLALYKIEPWVSSGVDAIRHPVSLRGKPFYPSIFIKPHLHITSNL